VDIAIFPPGLSLGNTLQCSLSFLNHSENWVCWLITTNETHFISEKIAGNEDRIRVISQENLKEAILGLDDNVEFHYLVGPGTREIQLNCISLLFNNSYTPTFWFIEEFFDKKKNKRHLTSYSESRIELVPMSENKVHSILPEGDINFIQSKGVGWDINFNRFTFKIIFPHNASLLGKVKVRIFQDQVIQDFQDTKKRFGAHGVIGSHEPIPNTWPIEALDRFKNEGISGGRGQ
jgi:hypothetical protein|tara:strand:- start:27 stop:728 length:702 start_codon:yes stop_codon:yes gene_type:complete